MSKKQETIINGIDVSECSYYNKDNEPYCCEIWDNECEAQNCYFKQLKRLQKENEGLKEKNSQKSNLIWYIFHCSEIDTIQRLLYEYYECINDDRYNKKRVKKFWDDVFYLQPRRKYKSKYKQALEEIRGMILDFGNTPIEFNTLNIPLKKEDLKTNEGKFFDFYTKLKNKINEVLNDRN